MSDNRQSQNIFKKRINVRQMLDMMRMGKALGKTIFFYGGAGLGKSQKMKQIADTMYPHRVGNNLCDVRLSDKEPTDLTGAQIPFTTVVNGKEVTRTVYATPEFWPTDPDWEGIVFLDELPNAIIATQQSAYQVILDHIVGMFQFPKGAIFAGAGNRDTDNGGTTEMLGPLVNRMILCEVDYDLDIWIEDYAVPYRLHPVVIGFLKQFPDKFYTGDIVDRDAPPFATPRQWETVSGILYLKDKNFMDDYLTEIAIAGAVGQGLESEVLGYYNRFRKLPALDDIFSGAVTKFKIATEDQDLIYLLSQSGVARIEDEVMTDLTDEDFIKRVGNFLTFMYENFGVESPDTVMALMTRLFRAPAGKDPVLTRNPKRSKMVPMLRKNVPVVMEVVAIYLSRYGDIMEDFA